MRRSSPIRAMTIGAVVIAVSLAGCTTPTNPIALSSATTTTVTGTGTPKPTETPGPPLVVETVFDHTSLDPTRQSGGSGLILSKVLYQTLTTLDPADKRTVVPGLAEYSISPEGNWLTLRLRTGLRFSDGAPITSDDVIFTIDRAQGLGGATAALLGHLTLVRVDSRTVTVTSPGANFALPSILANPSLGILNSRAVIANGGTIGPQDTAAPWLTTHSAGSGPYVIADAKPGVSVTLAGNPTWSGPRPAFSDVVVRNATPAVQLRDIQSGAADIVLDLSPTQADTVNLRPAVSSVSITSTPSQSTAFLLLNHNPKVNRWTADPEFAQAVRLGLDVGALAQLAVDARPALGLIPEGITGAFTVAPPPTATAGGTPVPPSTTAPPFPTVPPSPSTRSPTATPTAPPLRDIAGARAALARSGYKGQPIPLAFASDRPIRGLAPGILATAISAQLGQVGIKVTLAPAPGAKALHDYEAGRDALGLWGWAPQYLDPEDYLEFAPGGAVALRAGWPREVDAEVDAATVVARAAYGRDRVAAFARWQELMNERSPFIPLIQPASHYAHGDRVTQLSTNPVWTLDISLTR